MVTELIIWQKKSEFSFAILIYFFYYLDRQFCLPLALLHSIHMLTQLLYEQVYDQTESKIIYLLGGQGKEGNSNKDRNFVN